MTAANLKDKRVRDLAQMAKKSGVPGWHAMRKDQLIDALVCRAKKAQAEAVNKRQECRVQAHNAVRDIERKIGSHSTTTVVNEERSQFT